MVNSVQGSAQALVSALGSSLSSITSVFSRSRVKTALIALAVGFLAVLIGSSVGMNHEGAQGYAYAQEAGAMPERANSGMMFMAQDAEQLDPGSGGAGSTSGSDAGSDLSTPPAETRMDYFDGWNRDLPAPESSRSGNSPAERAQGVMGMGSEEVSGYQALNDATQFLAFSRWTMDGIVTPSVLDFQGLMGGGIIDAMLTGIAGIGFAVAGVIFMVAGWAITAALSISFIGSATYHADRIFADVVGNTLFSGNVDANEILKFIVIALIILVVWRLIKMYTKNEESTKSALAPVGWLVGFMFVVGFIGHQSAKNHPDSQYVAAGDLSPIGQSAGERHNISSHVEDPSQWSFMSVGWAVSQVNAAAKSFSGVVNSVNSLLFSSVTQGMDSRVASIAPSECELYVKGMHATYQSTPAANVLDRGALLINYDNFVVNTLFTLYQTGVWGDSAGAGGAWCRISESAAGSHPSEQIMISRAAGLYPELIGQGGLGLVAAGNGSNLGNTDGSDSGVEVIDPDAQRPTNYIVDPFSTYAPGFNGREANVASGTLVRGDGSWANQDQNNIQAASNFFGPNYKSKAGVYASRFYFAGCMWEQGQPAKLRPEWEGVQRAAGDTALEDGSCTDQITSGLERTGGFGYIRDSSGEDELSADMAWNYSPFTDITRDAEFGDSGNVEERGWLENFLRKSDFIDGIASAGETVSGSNVDTIGIRQRMNPAYTPSTRYEPASSAAYGDNGMYHVVMAGNGPENYFDRIAGQSSMSTLVFGLLAAGFGIAMIKPMFGIIIGALGAQLIGGVALLAMALFVILLLIPARAIRDLFKTGALTVVASFFVATILHILLSTIILLSTLLLALMGVESLGGGFWKAALIVLVYYFTFRGALAIVNKLFAINLMDFRDTVKVLATAGSPMLNKMGASVANPLDFMADRTKDRFNKAKNALPFNKGRDEEKARNAVDAGSDLNARRKDAEARRLADAKKGINAEALARDKKKGLKTGAQDAKKGKLDRFLNNRLTDSVKKYGALGSKIPVVGGYAAGAAAGVAGAQKAYSVGSNFKGKSQKGYESLKSLKGRLMTKDGLNGSNAGDLEVNGKMGESGKNDNNLEFSKHRTKENNFAARVREESPFSMLKPGVLQGMVSNMLGAGSIEDYSQEELDEADRWFQGRKQNAVGQDFWKKQADSRAMMEMGVDITNDDVYKRMAGSGVSSFVGSHERGVPSELMNNLDKEIRKRTQEIVPQPNSSGIVDFGSVSGQGDILEVLRNGDEVATAARSDHLVNPIKIDIQDAVNSGAAIIPGSDMADGTVRTVNSMNTSGAGHSVDAVDDAVGRLREAADKLSGAADRVAAPQGSPAADQINQFESAVKNVIGSQGPGQSQESAALNNLVEEARNTGFISQQMMSRMQDMAENSIDRSSFESLGTLVREWGNMSATGNLSGAQNVQPQAPQSSPQRSSDLGHLFGDD